MEEKQGKTARFRHFWQLQIRGISSLYDRHTLTEFIKTLRRYTEKSIMPLTLQRKAWKYKKLTGQ